MILDLQGNPIWFPLIDREFARGPWALQFSVYDYGAGRRAASVRMSWRGIGAKAARKAPKEFRGEIHWRDTEATGVGLVEAVIRTGEGAFALADWMQEVTKNESPQHISDKMWLKFIEIVRKTVGKPLTSPPSAGAQPAPSPAPESV